MTDIMKRTRAAVAYLNGKPRPDANAELEAYMAIFHPEKRREPSHAPKGDRR